MRWATAVVPRRLLDPAVGDGVFIRAFVERSQRDTRLRRTRIIACELDPRLAARFSASSEARALGGRLELRTADFLRARFDGGFDAAVCNPPYVRHHDHACDDGIFDAFDRRLGRRVPRTTNLYGLFMLRIWSLLAPGGRAAIITPAEWLNADFGRTLKRYFLDENAIDEIIHFDHRATVFNDVLTTAAITLLRRGRRSNEPVRLRRVRRTRELFSGRTTRAVARDELDPDAKWSPLFDPDSNGASAGAKLEQFARCVRGIATGANEFFVLRPSELLRHGLDRADVRICVSKAAHIRGPRLTRSDVQRLIDADERIYLLDPRTPLRPAVRRYLALGRRAGVHRRYLPAHRPIWYRPEQRDPAPVWINVFARSGFRFVRNEAGVSHLTAFHSIYPHDGIDADRLHALLSRRDTQRRIAAEQRLYAAGLRKLEPRDVERIALPRGDVRI